MRDACSNPIYSPVPGRQASTLDEQLSPLSTTSFDSRRRPLAQNSPPAQSPHGGQHRIRLDEAGLVYPPPDLPTTIEIPAISSTDTELRLPYYQRRGRFLVWPASNCREEGRAGSSTK